MKTRRLRVFHNRSYRETLLRPALPPQEGVTEQRILCSQRQLRRRAVHESGHALAALNLPGCRLEVVWIWPYTGLNENGIAGWCGYEYRSELDRVIIAVASKVAIRETYGRITPDDRQEAGGDSTSALCAACEILDYPEWEELGCDDPRRTNAQSFLRAAERMARSLIRAYRRQLDGLVEALCQPPHRLDWQQAHRLIGCNSRPETPCSESGPGL